MNYHGAPLQGQRDDDGPGEITDMARQGSKGPMCKVTLVKDGDHGLDAPRPTSPLIAGTCGLLGGEWRVDPHDRRGYSQSRPSSDLVFASSHPFRFSVPELRAFSPSQALART